MMMMTPAAPNRTPQESNWPSRRDDRHVDLGMMAMMSSSRSCRETTSAPVEANGLAGLLRAPLGMIQATVFG
jgi:hypothetical protein